MINKPKTGGTVESQFYEPPRETKICSKNQRVQEIRGKITVLDRGGKTTLGSSYLEVRKTEGLRNRDSTVNCNNNHALYRHLLAL